MSCKIAFITYETPFAPCGGVAAVVGRLPRYLQKASGLDTIVITPYHHQIKKTASLQMEQAGNVGVPFEDIEITVNIFRYEDDDKGLWYFLLPDDRRFFAGKRHPYDVGESQDQIAKNLKRDSLFFGVAAAKSLHVIASGVQWILSLQDWEAATTALALATQENSHKSFLTIHNSYDSGAVSESELWSVGINPDHCIGPTGTLAATVLERALPLTTGPVFTVSDQFALDLTQDKFQAEVMAPHLQKLLRLRLHGVDNGPFADIAVTDDILLDAARGNFKPLQDWKMDMRENALEALEKHTPSEKEPVWGNFSEFMKDDAPWFVLAGRDDTRQKGYDVAVLAIERFLNRKGNARFLFFPIPGDEGIVGLNFLEQLAEEYPDSVLALPFIFKAGFFAALRGATYGIMPSLYEPFGMANEFYLNGTPGIGRATGGIIQQIIPLRAISAFSRAVREKAERWHTASAQPTGILYRERDDIVSALDAWKSINAAEYDNKGGAPNRVSERKNYALFQSMADELLVSIEDSIQVYHNDSRLYYRMITDGINYIRRSFSWKRAASEYARYLR